jgi:hypothetical protein
MPSHARDYAALRTARAHASTAMPRTFFIRSASEMPGPRSREMSREIVAARRFDLCGQLFPRQAVRHPVSLQLRRTILAFRHGRAR